MYLTSPSDKAMLFANRYLDSKKEYFDAAKDFKKISEVFSKIQPQDLAYYKEISYRILKTLYEIQH